MCCKVCVTLWQDVVQSDKGVEGPICPDRLVCTSLVLPHSGQRGRGLAGVYAVMLYFDPFFFRGSMATRRGAEEPPPPPPDMFYRVFRDESVARKTGILCVTSLLSVASCVVCRGQ